MDQDITAGRIAAYLGMTVLRTHGDMGRRVLAPRALSQAGRGDLTFLKHADANLIDLLAGIPGAVVVAPVDSRIDDTIAHRLDVTILVAANPRLAFLRAVAKAFTSPPAAGIHPTAIVHPSARIHPAAFVGPYVVVDEDCEVGEGCVLHAHVHLYARVRLGRNVVVNGGTIIGADGFGYERNEAGELEKFPHLGGVVIEDEVEIGSNTSIDRGTLGDTIIRRGARVDNQVHVAHNVVVGRHAAVIAQSMLGGGVTVGDHAWIAPAATVLNQISIGNGAMVGMGAVVVKPVRDGETVAGSPALPIDEFRRRQRFLNDSAGGA